MCQDASRVSYVVVGSYERLACYCITHPFFLGFITLAFFTLKLEISGQVVKSLPSLLFIMLKKRIFADGMNLSGFLLLRWWNGRHEGLKIP